MDADSGIRSMMFSRRFSEKYPMRTRLLVAVLLICLNPCFAFHAAADDAADASQFANDLGHKALAVMGGRGGAQEKRSKLEAMFQQNVDIDWIGQFVLGRSWHDATPEQRTQYLANYRAFLIAHYTSSFSDFTNTNFQVTRVSPDPRGGNVVMMRIKRPGQEDIVVNYTIRKKDGGSLMVYDITVEGVSMITTERSEFASVVSQKGLDYLIQQLGERSKMENQKN